MSFTSLYNLPDRKEAGKIKYNTRRFLERLEKLGLPDWRTLELRTAALLLLRAADSIIETDPWGNIIEPETVMDNGMRRLNIGELNLIKLIEKEQGPEGWAGVSEELCTLIHPLPRRLIEFQKMDIGGKVRLTEEGQGVLNALKWL